MPDSSLKFYTTQELADLWGFGESTIRKRIAEGKITAIKDGVNLTRITHAAAEAYAASLPKIRPRLK